MASIIVDTALPGVSLPEVRQTLFAAAEKLNKKRNFHGVTQFATVYVGEELAHPATERTSFLVSFSDKDRVARRYIRLALGRMEELGRERLLRSEQVSANWYASVRVDPCMT